MALMTTSLDDRLALAAALARRAGELAHTGFGRSPSSLKGRHDVLTEMDPKVERLIRAALAEAYPGDAFLGEEDGISGTLAAGGRVWVVDPIDGTANYARGIDRYCVSIACVEDGRPVVGVIYDPCHDRLYGARTGGGAWQGERRLAVSPVTGLEAAVVECGWSMRRPTADWVAMVGRIVDSGAQARRSGSGAMGLVDVAAGRIEGYAELHINSWDCAAGLLLVQEAGGRVCDFFAGAGLTEGNPLLAGNAALYDELARVTGLA